MIIPLTVTITPAMSQEKHPIQPARLRISGVVAAGLLAASNLVSAQEALAPIDPSVPMIEEVPSPALPADTAAAPVAPADPAAPATPAFVPAEPLPAVPAAAPVLPDDDTVTHSSSVGPVEAISPLSNFKAGEAGGSTSEKMRENDESHWTFSIESAVVYDDNIRLSSSNKEKDTVFTFGPKAEYRGGDLGRKRNGYRIFSYQPEAAVFIDATGENAVDHHLLVDLQERFGDWLIGVEGGYERLSGATPDLGDRVERDEAHGKLRVGYDFGGDISADNTLGYRAVTYREGNLADYREWVNETFVGYQVSGAVKVSAGGGFGSLDVDRFSRQDFQRALVKVSASPLDDITVEGSGGVEFRQTDAGDETNPVFRLSTGFKPTEGLSLGMEAFREVSASGGVPGENVTRTGAAVQVRQQFGNHVSAGLSAGLEQADYADTTGTTASGQDRSDDYLFVRPSVRYEFTEGRRAEIYWSFRQDDSSVSDFSFEGNQVGLSLLFDF